MLVYAYNTLTCYLCIFYMHDVLKKLYYHHHMSVVILLQKNKYFRLLAFTHMFKFLSQISTHLISQDRFDMVM
jgi:DNA topoisomerase IB